MANVPNQAPNTISAAGAVTPSRFNHIIASAAIAMTLAAPTYDGQSVSFIDETGHAHTLVCTGAGSPPTAGLNGGTTSNELTFGGAKGDSVELVSRNGFWWTVVLNGVTVS